MNTSYQGNRSKTWVNQAFRGLLSSGPYIIIFLTFIITVASIASLSMVDIITGRITGAHLTGDSWFGTYVSLGTTGLLTGAIALLIHLFKQKKYNFWIIIPVGLIVFGLQVIDCYFDAVSVDIKRFGAIIIPSAVLVAAEIPAHNFYRILVAGISLVGEPISASAIVIFPMLKNFLSSMLKTVDDMKEDAYSHGWQGQASTNQPRPAPRPAQRPVSNIPASIPRKPINYPTPVYDEPVYHPVGLKTESKNYTQREL